MRKMFHIALGLAGIWLIAYPATGQELTDKHIAVALRKIGHEILLNSGDSTSRVLSIEKEGKQYRIPFEAEFGFKPEALVASITSIIDEAQIARRYIVEVERCGVTDVVYSFEIDQLRHKDIVPCRSREQPISCYHLLFTILEEPDIPWPHADTAGTSGWPIAPWNALIIVLIAIMLVGYVWVKTSNSKKGQAELVRLGKYRFDQRNALLILDNQKTELSGKEVDLLQLLYSSANSTVKRETMLHQVWGDEGSYIGRTLDVFISKLRNKLQEDPDIRIVNTRGVGYKLVINE